MNNDSGGIGCLIIPLAGALIVAILFGIGYINDAAANLNDSRAHLEYTRAQGESMVIRAQGQNRLDTAAAYSERVSASAAAFSERSLSAAQAFAIGASAFTGAALPWLIVLAIVAGVVMVVVLAMRSAPVVIEARRLPPPQKVIERQTVILLQPGQSRRELYRLLSDSKTPLLIDAQRGERGER